MARSLHTQRLDIRAQRRVARPHSKRQKEAASLIGPRERPDRAASRLRILRQKPPPGMQSPLTPQEVRSLLELLGPVAIYGLSAIRLCRESALRREGIVFAEYAPPDEVHLYAVPQGPWKLPFLLYEEDLAAFTHYGAQIEIDPDRQQTIVRWSADGWKRFALQEVLAHELGHHRLQYHRGKRTVRICRRSDHEKRADLYSRRVRKILQQAVEAE